MTRPSTQEVYANFEPLGTWLRAADAEAAQPILDEDATKRDRLLALQDIAGIPVPMYRFFNLEQLDDGEPVLKAFPTAYPDRDKFAAALLPDEPGGMVNRQRGLTLQECLAWGRANRPAGGHTFLVEPSYEDNLWSTIFVVGDEGVHGEIVAGQHFQLTQGTHLDQRPVQFLLDRHGLQYSTYDMPEGMARAVLQFLGAVTFYDEAIQARLETELDATFNDRNRLKGYFEGVIDKRFGMALIDYNRLLGEYFPLPEYLRRIPLDFGGTVAVKGWAEGALTAPDDISDEERPTILTANLTAAKDVPAMHLAEGIVTEQGGVTSHAAIVARMLEKPCVVGVKGICGQIGRQAVLDADQGVVMFSD